MYLARCLLEQSEESLSLLQLEVGVKHERRFFLWGLEEVKKSFIAYLDIICSSGIICHINCEVNFSKVPRHLDVLLWQRFIQTFSETKFYSMEHCVQLCNQGILVPVCGV